MSKLSRRSISRKSFRNLLSLLESEECIDIMMDGKLLEQNVLKLRAVVLPFCKIFSKKMLQQLMRLNKWEIKFIKSIYA